MKRKITQQNSQMWRSLWLLLLVFMGGVYNPSAATTVGQVLKVEEVYIGSTDDSYKTTYSLLNKSYLSFTVITPTTSKYTNGAVSVQASDKASFSSEALTIPSLIYVKESNTYYPYAVTTIPDNAFKDKGALITDLLFTPDNNSGYQLTTIGDNAFEGAALTGTIQLPRTIKTIGDNAFALLSGTGTIADVVLGANGVTGSPTLNFGKSVFGNRTITNLHVLGNFSYATYSADQTFNNINVTNLMYYSDEKTKSKKGDGNEGYYQFLSTTLSKYPKFTQFCKNLYLPANDVKNFVTKCTNSAWIPETVNCLTFKKTTEDGSTYTLMLKSSNGGYELALHGAEVKVTNLNLDFRNWGDIDILPTTSSLYGNVVQIDSKAFAGNNNLQSITIISTDPCKIESNAFQGLKSLRYLDLSNENITMATDYTLTRIPTTLDDESVAYKYTKSTQEYKYELSELTPFGGLPAYTLVFMPKKSDGSYPSYPSETQKKETVYKIDKIDDPTPTKWERPLDENYMLGYNDGDKSHWYCDNFGVYDVPELIPSNASDPSCSWYSWSTPDDFQVKVQSTFYRDFKAGVPSSVCLPFAPDPTKDATFYTFKSTDGSSVTLTSVDQPKANTPYFIRPTADTQLTSTQPQTITSSATISNTDNMHGVYTGQSMENISNAYGMSAKAFTTSNGTTYPAGTFFKLKQSANTFITPFRAYLTLSGAGAKASIMRLVIDDSTTGIKKTTADNDKATPYYNLQGIETAHPKKGIYIHNGRKVLIP